MGELKAHRFWDFDEISRTDAIVGSLYYLKSEADKVIAQLKDFEGVGHRMKGMNGRNQWHNN